MPIKVILTGVEKEVEPDLGEVISVVRGNGSELLVVNDVELRSDILGDKVADKPDQGGVSAGETKELATAGSRFPFGDFLPILEAGVQDVSGTAPDFSTTKVAAVEGSASEDFNGSKPGVFLREVIVQPSSMVKSKRPKRLVEFIRPVDGCVKHHGTGHVLDGLNGALSIAILVMGAGGGTIDRLARSGKFGIEVFGSKHAVIGVVVLDFYAGATSEVFKDAFCRDGVGGGQRGLIFNMDVSTSMVYK